MASRKKPTSIVSSKPTYPVVGRDLPFHATVELFDTTMTGLRRAQSMGCILYAVAIAYSDLHRLKELIPAIGHLCYVIHSSIVYVGHGNGDRKFGDRLSEAELEGAQLYVLYSLDPRFDKPAAAYVEARFIDRLFAMGAPLANLNRPFGSGLTQDAGLEQLVRQAEVLLGVAGFRPLEVGDREPRRPTEILGNSRLIEGVEPFEPEQMPTRPANSKLYRLNIRGMHADGFYIGRTFYVQPGAEYALALRRGMSTHNKVRRKTVEKYLEPIAGIEHLKRLRVGLKCKSSPIAAKILSGKPVGLSAWLAVQ